MSDPSLISSGFEGEGEIESASVVSGITGSGIWGGYLLYFILLRGGSGGREKGRGFG